VEAIGFTALDVLACLQPFAYTFSVLVPHTENVMARSVRNAKLDTRTARLEPYFVRMDAEAFIGCRRLSSGSGTWIARLRDDRGKQHYQALGSADDIMVADSVVNIFTFGEAQERA
jgi:hypothetical protein